MWSTSECRDNLTEKTTQKTSREHWNSCRKVLEITKTLISEIKTEKKWLGSGRNYWPTPVEERTQKKKNPPEKPHAPVPDPDLAGKQSPSSGAWGIVFRWFLLGCGRLSFPSLVIVLVFSQHPQKWRWHKTTDAQWPFIYLFSFFPHWYSDTMWEILKKVLLTCVFTLLHKDPIDTTI